MTRIGSLCSGYGGLDLALDGQVVWHAEIDPAASRVLDAHWPDVPNLGDLTAVDWATVQPVDVLTAGFPCQPASLAGKRSGMTDERWLWDDVARAVAGVRPRWVVLENVPGLLTVDRGRAFERVVCDLAAMGYVGQHGLVRACDAGAPHRRERLFVIADAAGIGRGEGWPEPARRLGRPAAVLGGAPAADTDGIGGHGRGARSGRWPEPAHRSDAAADADRQRVEGDLRPVRCDPDGRDRADIAWGPYEPAIRRWEHVTGRRVPRPTEPGRRSERLSPRFVEWMQGLPDGWVTDIPGITRTQQLKCLGNGVVPAQAALALRLLTSGQVAA